MLFVTNDGTRWGSGVARELVASEIDDNFWELRKALNDLIANPGSPVSIASIDPGSNGQITFNMSDGSAIGPITIPIPEIHWRDAWLPDVAYETMDVTSVAGVGLYWVLQDHVSAATFDKAFTIGGNPAYLEMFAFAPPVNFAVDVGSYYPGVLKDVSSDVAYLYQEPFARSILIPATPFPGTAHQAYLQNVPTTEAQDFNIYQNDVVVGSIHFEIGANTGAVSIASDIALEISGRLAIGRQLVDDATAGGFSFEFAGTQVIA